jgi:hypothetical protein
MNNHSAIAPEKIRRNVKEAGSPLFSFNAARHRSELLAKAIIARSVSIKILVNFTIDEIGAESLCKRRNNLIGSTLLSSIIHASYCTPLSWSRAARRGPEMASGRHASKR